MAEEPGSGDHDEDAESELDVGTYNLRGTRDFPKKKRKNPWSFQEIQIFQKGLELFGHKWTKIADLIETRNALQVKSYANRYFKNKAKEESESLIMISALTSSEVRMEVEETNYDVDVEDLLPNSQHESVVKEIAAEKKEIDEKETNKDMTTHTVTSAPPAGDKQSTPDVSCKQSTLPSLEECGSAVSLPEISPRSDSKDSLNEGASLPQQSDVTNLKTVEEVQEEGHEKLEKTGMDSKQTVDSPSSSELSRSSKSPNTPFPVTETHNDKCESESIAVEDSSPLTSVDASNGKGELNSSKESDIIPEDEATQICDALFETLSPASNDIECPDKLCISIQLEPQQRKTYPTRPGVLRRASRANKQRYVVASNIPANQPKPTVKKPRKRAPSKSEQPKVDSLLTRRVTRHSKPMGESPESLKVSISLADLDNYPGKIAEPKPECVLSTQTLSEGWMMQREMNKDKNEQFRVDNIKVDRSAFGVIKYKAIDENGKLSEKVEILASRSSPGDVLVGFENIESTRLVAGHTLDTKPSIAEPVSGDTPDSSYMSGNAEMRLESDEKSDTPDADVANLESEQETDANKEAKHTAATSPAENVDKDKTSAENIEVGRITHPTDIDCIGSKGESEQETSEKHTESELEHVVVNTDIHTTEDKQVEATGEKKANKILGVLETAKTTPSNAGKSEVFNSKQSKKECEPTPAGINEDLPRMQVDKDRPRLRSRKKVDEKADLSRAKMETSNNKDDQDIDVDDGSKLTSEGRSLCENLASRVQQKTNDNRPEDGWEPVPVDSHAVDGDVRSSMGKEAPDSTVANCGASDNTAKTNTEIIEDQDAHNRNSEGSLPISAEITSKGTQEASAGKMRVDETMVEGEEGGVNTVKGEDEIGCSDHLAFRSENQFMKNRSFESADAAPRIHVETAEKEASKVLRMDISSIDRLDTNKECDDGIKGGDKADSVDKNIGHVTSSLVTEDDFVDYGKLNVSKDSSDRFLSDNNSSSLKSVKELSNLTTNQHSSNAEQLLAKKVQPYGRMIDKNANNMDVATDNKPSHDPLFQEIDHSQNMEKMGIYDVTSFDHSMEISFEEGDKRAREMISKSSPGMSDISKIDACTAEGGSAINDVNPLIQDTDYLSTTAMKYSHDQKLMPCDEFGDDRAESLSFMNCNLSTNLHEEDMKTSGEPLLDDREFSFSSSVAKMKYSDEHTSVIGKNEMMIEPSAFIKEDTELLRANEELINKEDNLDKHLVCSQNYESEKWQLEHDSETGVFEKTFLEQVNGPKLDNDPFLAANAHPFVEDSDPKLTTFMDDFSESNHSNSSSPLSEAGGPYGLQAIPYECAVKLTEIPLAGLEYAKGIAECETSDSSSDEEDSNDNELSASSDSDMSDSESSSSSSSSSYSESSDCNDDNGCSESSSEVEEKITVQIPKRVEIEELCHKQVDPTPVPRKMKEIHFKEDEITAIEKKECREFFRGKQSKSPSKYLQIRNFITNEWKKIKPLYLSRNSLRSKVDPKEANAVGRVHAFLENHGAINIGCSTKNKWVERMEKRREKFQNVKRLTSVSETELVDKSSNFNIAKENTVAPPTKELELDYDHITEEEKCAHQQYFNGNKHKSPDKYLKIRNSIIDCWKDSKPAYLTKQAARLAMSWYCGDLNAVSRVHDYLELIGAINFGCAFEPRRGRPSRARMSQERLVRGDASEKKYSKIAKRALSKKSAENRDLKSKEYADKSKKEEKPVSSFRKSEDSGLETSVSVNVSNIEVEKESSNCISVLNTKKKRGRKPNSLKRKLGPRTLKQEDAPQSDNYGNFSKVELEQRREFISERETGPPSDKSSTGDSGFDSISEISPCVDPESAVLSSKLLALREDSNLSVPEDYADEATPTEERSLDLNIITDEEKAGCPEFFIGSRVKPPEKYVKIRNSIIKSWQRKRPQYVNKHNARCDMPWYSGDINSIGRVHAFLERIGVINLGALRKVKRTGRKRKFESMPKYNVSSPDSEGAYEASNKVLDSELLNNEMLSQCEKDALRTSICEGNNEMWTPQTYLKIRSVIKEMWSKCKPRYLCKTEVYQRFIDDYHALNFVTEVHAFMEAAGLINVGLTDNQPPKNDVWDMKRSFSLGLRPRKRWIMDINKDWLDKTDSEGYTIRHLSPDDDRMESKQRSLAFSNKIRKSLPESDPYKLVPCRTFSSDSATPFTVTICLKALLVMDFHSYLSSSEVIGLVGGKYYHATRRLEVMRVAPCSNVGTNLQCEMDPVSQAKASSDLAQQGLEVVGWYHSHPTFAPTPSLRDIDTQSTFQEWFSRDGAPFVGIIISPYNMSHIEVPHKSQITCLTISDQWDDSRSYRIPYMFKFKTEDLEKSDSFDDTIQQLKTTMRTVEGCKSYLCQGRLGNYPPGLLLSKSLEAKLNRKTSRKDEFLCQVKELIGI